MILAIFSCITARRSDFLLNMFQKQCSFWQRPTLLLSFFPHSNRSDTLLIFSFCFTYTLCKPELWVDHTMSENYASFIPTPRPNHMFLNYAACFHSWLRIWLSLFGLYHHCQIDWQVFLLINRLKLNGDTVNWYTVKHHNQLRKKTDCSFTY